jgi:GGDEF domain-containing protein
MSSVFPSSFTGTRAVSASRRRTPVRWDVLNHVARWLGLAATRRASAASSVPAKSWEWHKGAMLAAGDELLERARLENQPVSVAVFALSDLPELESVFGAEIAKDVLNEIALRLQGIATSRGLAIRTDSTVFTVLMPGFGRDRAHQAIERTMGSPCCIELNADDHEIVLVPEFKVHTMRSDSGSLAQVCQDLCRDIAEAQQLEQRRRRYLQRERESHTRPMELRSDDHGKRINTLQRPSAANDATMPVPLRR